MSSREIALPQVERTRALGEKLGGLLQRGDFIGLSGPLGAGKTELARAICTGAHVPLSQVGSPTFAIVATYQGGRIPIHHADLFRVASREELLATGYFDLLGPDAAAIVEWVERIPGAEPPDALLLELELTGPDSRLLRARTRGERSERLLAAWF